MRSSRQHLAARFRPPCGTHVRSSVPLRKRIRRDARPTATPVAPSWDVVEPLAVHYPALIPPSPGGRGGIGGGSRGGAQAWPVGSCRAVRVVASQGNRVG